jgi:hypothetical protein
MTRSQLLIGLQDFLDCIIEDSYGNIAEDGVESVPSESGDSTPTGTILSTVDSNATAKQELPRLSSLNLARTTVHDVAVDVVVTPRTSGGATRKGSMLEKHGFLNNALQASMIVSVWGIEDEQYFTLTFTSASSVEPAAVARPSSRIVTRSNTGFQYLNKSRGSGSSTSSSNRSQTISPNPASKVVTSTFQNTEFPPRGPPSKVLNDMSSSASIFQKATQLKDAILSSINMPSYGMQHLAFFFLSLTSFSYVERRILWDS